MSPEEIVALIGNIGNRPYIRQVQEHQVKEIREYDAGLFEDLAKHTDEHIQQKMDPTSTEDWIMDRVSKALRIKAMEIRIGRI
jgi:hypothetical protein